MHPLVDAPTLARHLDDPDWLVFDVRHELMQPALGEALYRESHIDGARFASVDRDLSGAKDGSNGRHPLPTREAFATYLRASGADASSALVAYDASNGLYAARFWWLARWLGHDRVAILDGGLAAWTAHGLPMSTAPFRATPGTFASREPLVAWVDTPTIEANLIDQEATVVDARAAERYRGDVEPIDPVAGHIPGAINRPMAMNLESDGRFRDAAALRADFDALLAGRHASALVHSCGSGVTACHNLLAMEIAGLPGAALYPGSWSAWCSDADRPVVRGARP